LKKGKNKQKPNQIASPPQR